MSAWHATLPLAQLPEGGRAVVVVGHEQVLLLRRGDEVHAVQALCPHKFGALVEGRLDGQRLSCPVHEATFDVCTGQAQPGGVWSGPLRVYPARVREGMVEVQAG